jgi:tricarballylate dehydrogenase
VTDYDVLIVGCGGAALTAALSALEHSPSGPPLRVGLLERTSRDERGGSTAWTTSQFRVDDNAQLHQSFIDTVRETAGPLANVAYCETLHEQVPDTLNWLRKHGIEIGRHRPPFAMSFGTSAWFVTGGGRAIVDTLAPLVEDLGGVIEYETTALDLSTDDDGVVDGVVVRDPGGRIGIRRARRVVLACGGFEGNREMMTQYIGRQAWTLETVAPGSHANRGEGIRMAMALGAATAGQFDRFHGEPVDPRSAHPEALINAYAFGILVNEHGQRFMDEGREPIDLSFDNVALEIFRNQNQRAYAIIDAGIRETFPGVEMAITTEQPSIKAHSIDELAALIEVDACALRHTMRAYNESIQEGAFDATSMDGKSTSGLTPPKSNWALPLDHPPFEAYPVTCRICFTFGGIDTDQHGRVRTPEGSVIPGLYAAGEITGIYYEAYPGGTSVLRSLTFGRLAGEHIADDLGTT